MKKYLTFLLTLVLINNTSKAQIIPGLFTNYVQGGINSDAFTTNNFKCIGVGKGNVIWAGTQYGGLYRYSQSVNLWLKSTLLTNVSINDIKSDPDSGIWIAHSGTVSQGGNSNIAGGVNYFKDQYDVNMKFYSVYGTSVSADLLSRNARSIYLDQSYGIASNRLPRVWVAMGTYITSFNTRRGGLSIGINVDTPYFSRRYAGFSIFSNATPICEAIGGDGDEIWLASRQNGGGSRIVRYKPSGELKSPPYGDTNVAQLQVGFSAQAIFSDMYKNKWIGMKSGGLVINTGNDVWKKMDAQSLIAPGVQINYNAIAGDQFGNIYIGTSDGLLEYLSPEWNTGSSPDYTPSYNRYTTAQGLPDNNITGVAYDKEYGRVLLTSSGGVTFMNVREPFIKGKVVDVFCDVDGEKKYIGLQKIPLSTGVTVTLLKEGVEKEVARPNANGIFEFVKAEDNTDYTVEVKYSAEGRQMRYLYNKVRNHTRLQPILIPDSLIRELKTFKAKMKNRCFDLKLGYGIEYKEAYCAEGFDIFGYDFASEEFYKPGGIEEDHTKRVENLATYYLAMATVYNLGGIATGLTSDACNNLLDAAESLVLFLEFHGSLKLPENADFFSKVNIDEKAAAVAAANLLKVHITNILNASSASLTAFPEAKATFDRCISALAGLADLVIECIDKGGNRAALKAVTDNLKKIIAFGVSINFYTEDYVKGNHNRFIYETSGAAKLLKGKLNYSAAYDNLYNLNAESVAKEAKTKLEDATKTIETLTKLAANVEYAGNVVDAAAALALIPGGQVAGAIAKFLSYAAKTVKTVALVGAMFTAAVGANEVTDISEKIIPKSGLERPAASGIINQPSGLAISLPDSLVIRKNNYNTRLTDLQAVYAAAYDSTVYSAKYKLFAKEDSFYTAEMDKTLNSLWSCADSAVSRIPNFKSRLSRVVDSFVDLQYTLRLSLYYQNIAFIFGPDKNPFRPALDSLSNEIKLANDSAVNGIVSLFKDINNNGIVSPASLVNDGYQINFSRVAGSSGTVTYSFRNYGGEAQTNVSFKISKPTAGYNITSADSVNVGTIQPGQTKLVSYTFASPQTDSPGQFTITVKASNGKYRDVWGTLYVIDPSKFYSVKDGDWNNPATWSSGVVPGVNNKVYIRHVITITANASCKTTNIITPGKVIVNAGKSLNISK